MDRKKIAIIACGINGISTQVSKRIAESEIYERVKIISLSDDLQFIDETNISPQLKQELENLGANVGLSLSEVLQRLKQISAPPIEIKTHNIEDFKNIGLAAEKLDNYRPGFYPDAKIEQFQDKNPGAKVGGRKHKKNPFRKGGNKW